MWPFKHKHKPDTSLSKSKMACSLVTGVPIQVSYTSVCSCGLVLDKTLSSAGYQQLSWGADYESLFDDGPIRVKVGSEDLVKQMQESFNKQIGFTTGCGCSCP